MTSNEWHDMQRTSVNQRIAEIEKQISELQAESRRLSELIAIITKRKEESNVAIVGRYQQR